MHTLGTKQWAQDRFEERSHQPVELVKDKEEINRFLILGSEEAGRRVVLFLLPDDD
jgi:hypothetical protein